MHDCAIVSLIVLLRGFPCSHDFSRGSSHPYILAHYFSRMIFALVYSASASLKCGVRDHVQYNY